MQSHYMISECDGALYDTRAQNWSEKPLRVNFAWHHKTIKSVTDLKATLRAGKFTFPGGYELVFITSDGAAICFACARENFALVADSIRTRTDDGWRIVACDIAYHYESGLSCDHCSRELVEYKE